MVKLLFSRSHLIGSVFISKLTKNPGQKWQDCPSHVAVEFEGLFVLESVFNGGFRINNIYKFRNENIVLKEVIYKPENEKELLQRLIITFWNHKYDFFGAIFLGLARFFNFTTTENPLSSKRKSFCSEILSELFKKDCSLLTPNDILNEFKMLGEEINVHNNER